jgi:hypothetical protein
MKNRDGFIVVQKSPSVNKGRYNPRYRGVDRLVPWSMDQFKKGFDDPYLSPEYTTDDGFIVSLPLAQEVFQSFSEIIAPEDLEIIYIREVSGIEEESFLAKPGLKMIGFDVAGNGSPFYSIVDDFPPPNEGLFQDFREQLNENGLFESAGLAREYLRIYLERYPEEKNQDVVIWEVYLVTQNTI